MCWVSVLKDWVDKSLHKAELSGFTQQTPRLYVGATQNISTTSTKQFKFSILNSVINNITNCKVEGVAKRLERADYDLLIGERSLSHSS